MTVHRSQPAALILCVMACVSFILGSAAAEVFAGETPDAPDRSDRNEGNDGNSYDAALDDLRTEKDEMVQRLDDVEESFMMLEDDMEEILGAQDDAVKKAMENRLFWNASYRIAFSKSHLYDNTADFEIQGAIILGMDDAGQPISRKFGNRVRRGIDAWQQGSWVHRLRLAMSYELNESLRFYGRMVVYKYFNEVRTEDPPIDMYSNTFPRTTTLGLERAFIDWFAFDWLTLTFGRISSPDGPPAELRENTERKAGWGVQMIAAEMDGAMVTFHFDKLLEGALARFFYSPFQTHAAFSLSDPNSLYQDTDIKVMHTFGGLLEAKLPGLGENLLQLGAVLAPVFRPRDMPTIIRGVPDPVYPSQPEGDDMGFYGNINGLIEFKNMFGSGLDFFAAYVGTILKPSKNRMIYEVPVENLPLYTSNGKNIGTFDGVAEYKIGLASYEESWRSGEYKPTTNWAHMAYLGLRYTLPFSQNFWTRIGGEFNYSTKYNISWTVPSDFLIQKLATKGWAAEAYIIQQLVPDFLFARLGYVQIGRQYNGLYIGPTTRMDITVKNLYFLLDVAW